MVERSREEYILARWIVEPVDLRGFVQEQRLLNNRLLRFTEARFVWVVLGVFFVPIPLVALALATVLGGPSD